jgi:hypothetical protein
MIMVCDGVTGVFLGGPALFCFATALGGIPAALAPSSGAPAARLDLLFLCLLVGFCKCLETLRFYFEPTAASLGWLEVNRT